MSHVKAAAIVGVNVPITEDALSQVQSIRSFCFQLITSLWVYVLRHFPAVMGAGGADTVFLQLDSKTETLGAVGPASNTSTDEIPAGLPVWLCYRNQVGFVSMNFVCCRRICLDLLSILLPTSRMGNPKPPTCSSTTVLAKRNQKTKCFIQRPSRAWLPSSQNTEKSKM